MLGSIDLSVGSTVTLAGITTAMAVQAFGPPGVLLVVFAGAIVGLANGILHAGFRLPSFLVTLGMLSIVNGVALILSAGSPKPLPRTFLDDLMGGTVFGTVPLIAVWALGIWALMWFVSARTVFGRQVVAVGDGERVAALSGVPVRRVKLIVFTLSGVLAATGGLLLAVRTSSGSPGMGDVFLLDSIAAVVIGGTALTGGVGGPSRTLLGALTITVLSNGMTLLSVDPFYQVVTRGVVVIAAVLLTIRRDELHLIK
jgi:ribose/xylose/arabinose/galactoside ABC-type transport system permease subunit